MFAAKFLPQKVFSYLCISKYLRIGIPVYLVKTRMTREEEIHFDLTQQVEAHNEESDGSDDDDDDGDVVIVRKKKLKVIEDSESDDESDKNIAGITCKWRIEPENEDVSTKNIENETIVIVD